MTKRTILNLESINSIFLLDESLLEPSVLKGTRWVLRRERRSNPPDLSDYFDKDLIENYLLSLKVKPFEILTGNSGTGKTKLSQLFAKFLRDSNFHRIKVTTKARSWGYSEKKGTEGHDCGWTIRPEYVENIIPYPIKDSYEIEVGDYSTTAEIKIVPQLYYDKNNEELKNYFKSLYYAEREQIKNEKAKNINHEDRLIDLGISCESLQSIVFNDFIQSSNFSIKMNNINSFLNDGDVIISKGIYKYTPLNDVVDCVVSSGGISATAKFRLKFRMSNYLTDEIKKYLTSLKNDGKSSFELKIKNFVPIENFKPIFNNMNYKIVPIGANWTDNTNIVGYYNVITEDYQSTPAYELIKQAQNDLNNPYFLILDEMNLSHVERYFADFLSAIESGEEIPLYGNNETLKLPDNLFVIGTVNVDETTYMFSPKVLDRANTIEFDTLLAEDYMASNIDDDDFNGNINYLQSPLIDSDISNLKIEELKEILSEINCDDGNLWDVLADELTNFQKTLHGSSFDFGFRVINEILRFMVVSWRYENEPAKWNNWQRYFDAQIKQKILPKLHGSEKAIGGVLNNLFNICLVESDNNENPKNFKLTQDSSKYYTSALKLQSMSKILSNQRYVSFIN